MYPDGRRVRVGQKLRARLSSVNLERRQIDFEVLAFEGEEDLPARAPGDARGEQRPFRRQQHGRPGRHEHGRPPQREASRNRPEPERIAAPRPVAEPPVPALAELTARPASAVIKEAATTAPPAPEVRQEAPSRPSRRKPLPDAFPSHEQLRTQREAREAFRPALETGPIDKKLEKETEEREEAPAEVAGTSEPTEAPEVEVEASPHPGFDWLRALAAKRKGGRAVPPAAPKEAPARRKPVRAEVERGASKPARRAPAKGVKKAPGPKAKGGGTKEGGAKGGRTKEGGPKGGGTKGGGRKRR